MPLPKPNLFLSGFLTTAFVETGSHRGDGIQSALDAGFPCVYSVDISAFSYGWCSHRFRKNRAKVDLYLGDSREFLKLFLPRMTTRCTFWMDAHWCGGNGDALRHDGGDLNDVPLLGELQIIAGHTIKDHIILIDDVRLFGTDSYPNLDTIVCELGKINSNYTISFWNSSDFEKDILVAVPSKAQEAL